MTHAVNSGDLFPKVGSCEMVRYYDSLQFDIIHTHTDTDTHTNNQDKTICLLLNPVPSTSNMKGRAAWQGITDRP